MTKTKKYVRIKKSSNPAYWYADRIGEVFEVEGMDDTDYAVFIEDIGSSLVLKKDAELIVTEKRPAEVGERVLITEKPVRKDYEIYEPVTVDNVNIYGVESYKNGRPIFLNHYEYEVIVNNEVKNEEADEMENVEKRYEAAVENARDAIEELRLAAYAKGYEDARRELMATAPVEKTAQKRRDEIVEQAKADVERLRTNNRLWRTFDITFDINRESRTVEAVAKKPNSRTAFYGTAICAPDDCFNIHIGEAIALHRALGLEVPDEYLNAPQPTEVRVGDVVMHTVTSEIAPVISDDDWPPLTGDYVYHKDVEAARRYALIIDDSRTEAI